jgi:hypothetical protein
MTTDRFAVIDAETDPFKRYRVPKPFLWGFYDGTEYREFDNTADLVARVREYDGVVYAHNGGKFDFHFLLPYVEPYTEFMLIHGRIAKLPLGLAELRDSFCILPVPLAAYQKDEIDYSIMEVGERDKPANRAEISRYLRHDCTYLWNLVREFRATYGNHLTLAGAAMKQWEKMTPLGLPKTDEEFYRKLAPWYVGGRVQCFEQGEIHGHFSVVDIRSAYPRAMCERHPYSAHYVESKGFRPGADFYLLRCIARGCFPFRGMGLFGQPCLTFPDDDEVREYHVTRWEFEAAVDTLSVYDVEVLRSITFGGHTDFKPYVDHFYALKQDAEARDDKASRIFAKLFLNALYGKFGANPLEYEQAMFVPREVMHGLDALGWRAAGEIGPWGLAQAPMDDWRMRFYNVGTAASITGWVRAYLWRAICASEGVLYCDTDSLPARKPNVKIGEALGEWTHEGDFDRAGIAGKKLYVFENSITGAYKLASKGARLTKAEMWELARGGTVEWTSQSPSISVHRVPVTEAWEDEELGMKLFPTRKLRMTV